MKKKTPRDMNIAIKKKTKKTPIYKDPTTPQKEGKKQHPDDPMRCCGWNERNHTDRGGGEEDKAQPSYLISQMKKSPRSA